MGPHKRSATIEVIYERGRVLATGRFGTDKAGYRDMLAGGRRFPDRVWAIEGCNGIGKHLAHRLVHDAQRALGSNPSRHSNRPAIDLAWARCCACDTE
jgi:transposase